MTETYEPDEKEVDDLLQHLQQDAVSSGYIINPDMSFSHELVKGLLVNQARYGYQSCPCRLSSGNADEDRDLVCPCDYRDADLDEYGACYCALYVDQEVVDGVKKLRTIPERRGKESKKHNTEHNSYGENLAYPVWRCKVCGYLCAREQAPAQCPICKVGRERFELFMK